MRVLVCGGRGYRDVKSVFASLDGLSPGPHLIIHGGATGADACAAEWARKRGCESEIYQASWRTQGWAAGPIRNQRMLDHGRPELVVAFPGGSGTADMVRRAKAAGVTVIEVQ